MSNLWTKMLDFVKSDAGKGVLSVGGSLLLNSGDANSNYIPQTGYQGGIPDYTAVRSPVEIAYDPDRRPGSGGRRYFSDTTYAKPEEVETARTATQEQIAGLAALNASNPYKQNRPPAMVFPEREEQEQQEQRAASKVIEDLPANAPQQGLTNFEPKYATGGIAQLAKGRYLKGETDGMADQVRANIDGMQEARLSDGEYVIPADVVSHLGNGNSDAGAKVLDRFLSRVRKERTGNGKQGKEIDPNKMLPA
jgi:hypothetical protein